MLTLYCKAISGRILEVSYDEKTSIKELYRQVSTSVGNPDARLLQLITIPSNKLQVIVDPSKPLETVASYKIPDGQTLYIVYGKDHKNILYPSERNTIAKVAKADKLTRTEAFTLDGILTRPGILATPLSSASAAASATL